MLHPRAKVRTQMPHPWDVLDKQMPRGGPGGGGMGTLGFDSCIKSSLEYNYFTLFYYASSQGQGQHNSVSQLLWTRITYPTQSTFPVGGNRSTRRKPTTYGRALT